ncbi:glycosyltransferase family 2 protein [bacterium]|nr:glycosyltransferase family 2 protein [bacterium]
MEDNIKIEFPVTYPPLVSVIIPAYNCENTIIRAINSAFSQTYKNIEVIVIDDGSSDKTEINIKNLSNEVFYFKQENSGAASARNRGVELANGYFVAFLDSDDIWHPQKIELQLEMFTKIENIALCSTDMVRLKNDENVPEMKMIRRPLKVQIIQDFKKVFARPYLGTPSIMMKRKDYLAHNGMSENLVTGEDIDLWIRISYKNKIVNISEPLTLVFNVPYSLSKIREKARFEDNLQVINSFCDNHPDFLNSNERLIKESKSYVYIMWGSELLVEGKHDEAFKVLWLALKLRLSVHGVFLILKSFFFKIQSFVTYNNR